MRLFLIDPPMQSIMLARADWFPMGLAYLAGVARREGHEVLIYNGEHDPQLDYVNLTVYSSNYYLYLDALKDPSHTAWKRIASVMERFRPDVVGITSFSVKIPAALRIAAIAKDYNPQMPVILGGQHATIMTDEVLSDPNVDFVVRGEGEETFAELLRGLGGGQLWSRILGLSWKDNGRIVHNPDRPLIENLDSLPFPSRESLYDLENYTPHALETEEDVKQTEELLYRLRPDWAGISIFTPIPGTGQWKELRAQGKIPDRPDYARFSHQSPHSNFAFNMTERQAFPELAQHVLQFVEDYNGSWRNVLQRALTRGYLRNPKLLFYDLRKFVTWKGILQASHQGSHSKFYAKTTMIERE